MKAFLTIAAVMVILFSRGIACDSEATARKADLGYGWRDCFRADADYAVRCDLDVSNDDITDSWSEVIYLRRKRSKDEKGTAPFFFHEIDKGESPRGAGVHVVPNPRVDGLHIRLVLKWWADGTQKSLDAEAVVPFLQEATGSVGPFRYRITWQERVDGDAPQLSAK